MNKFNYKIKYIPIYIFCKTVFAAWSHFGVKLSMQDMFVSRAFNKLAIYRVDDVRIDFQYFIFKDLSLILR